MHVVNDLRRLAGTYLSRLRELIAAYPYRSTPSRLRDLIAANRYRSVLSALGVLILVSELVAHGQPPEKPTSTAFLAVIPTVTTVPSEVPRIAASPTDVPAAILDVASGMPTPLAPFVDENLPSPTLDGLSTPVITPVITSVATVGARSPTPNPAAATNAAVKSAAVESHPEAPIKLLIPKLGVKASVESVGIDRSGAMATPSGPFTVGWWEHGTVPGDPGNAVIDGHLDSARVGAAVFWRLGDLRAGDQILVQMPGNHTLTFVVDRSVTYPFDQAPLAEIFGPASIPSLNLVTCSGSFDRASKNYNRRLVVYSHLLKS